jgi:hypothetical protein
MEEKRWLKKLWKPSGEQWVTLKTAIQKWIVVVLVSYFTFSKK